MGEGCRVDGKGYRGRGHKAGAVLRMDCQSMDGFHCLSEKSMHGRISLRFLWRKAWMDLIVFLEKSMDG